MSIEDVEAALVGLTDEELDETIDRLAIHQGMSPNVEREWLGEVERRMATYDAGRTKGSSEEERLAKLHAMLAARHSRQGAIRQAWISEAERRMELVRAGQMRLLDADEALADPDYDD